MKGLRVGTEDPRGEAGALHNSRVIELISTNTAFHFPSLQLIVIKDSNQMVGTIAAQLQGSEFDIYTWYISSSFIFPAFYPETHLRISLPWPNSDLWFWASSTKLTKMKRLD